MNNKKSTCAICYDDKNLVRMRITCNHEFCKNCLIKVINARWESDDRSTLVSCPLCRQGMIKTNNRAVNRVLNAYIDEYELRKKYPFMGIKKTQLYFVMEDIEEKTRKNKRYPKKMKFKSYQKNLR